MAANFDTLIRLLELQHQKSDKYLKLLLEYQNIKSELEKSEIVIQKLIDGKLELMGKIEELSLKNQLHSREYNWLKGLKNKKIEELKKLKEENKKLKKSNKRLKKINKILLGECGEIRKICRDKKREINVAYTMLFLLIVSILIIYILKGIINNSKFF